ncbi:phage tail sheath subtilisin-like domain-containing protein [Streptomyces rimosus]|uniref:phage tail sheath subtilisin-like domain-containing protein n=1 Tax=Streptomyces rimosus TaxID=1927 RepID=UPI0004CC02F3|nr:phage tail sheath subtilisin-like domain-containing protein [Streptomyces rimosus]
MATTTYKRPGIFVDETLNPIVVNEPPAGEFVAAFVGAHDFGPSKPTLIRSWAEFVSLYAGFSGGMLPFAVHQFFSNGGRACYIVRAVAADAKTASLVLKDRQAGTGENSGAKDVLRLVATAAGTFANTIAISVTDAGTGPGRFNLTVKAGGDTAGGAVERYTDVSLDPTDARNAVALVNAPQSGSKFVTLTYLGPTTWKIDNTPAVTVDQMLAGGTNGVAAPDLSAAAQSLESTNVVLNINLPGVSDTAVLNPVIDWCERYGYAFLVVDSPQITEGTPTEVAVSKLKEMSPLVNGGTTPAPLRASSYAAVYGPWIQTADPAVAAVGATRLLPPGGALLGQFARFDVDHGPHRTPAGQDAVLRGVYSAQYRFTDAQLDELNVAGINVIRFVPNAGYCPMGGRTVKAGYPDRYIAVRRFLIHVRKLLVESTNYAVFQPNTPDLWASLTAVVTQRLTEMTQAGQLKGGSPETAFRVVCNETNNSAQSVANGEVHLDIGLALMRPAEFIAIHIGQWEGGSSSSEALQ